MDSPNDGARLPESHRPGQDTEPLNKSKRREKPVRHSVAQREQCEAMFGALFGRAPHGAGIVDITGVVWQTNEAACASAGCHVAEFPGRLFWESPWWTHAADVQDQIRRAIARAAGGEHVHVGTSQCARDGSVRNVDLVVRPVFGSDGRISALIWETWEVAQPGRLFEPTIPLIESVLEQSRVPIVVVSAPDGVVRMLNGSAVEVLGVAGRPNLLNMTLADVFSRKTWQLCRLDGSLVADDDMPVVHALRGEVTRREELCLVRPDGVRRWILANASPVRDREGHVMAAVLAFPDITELKEAELEIERRGRESELLISNMAAAFVMWNMEFDDRGSVKDIRFGYFNEAYERVSGVKLADACGKTVREIWPETEQSWYEVYGEVARSGMSRSFEMFHKPTRGIYACNAYRPGDSPDRVCVVFEDITERKKAEEQIQRYANEFRTILDTLTVGVCQLKNRRVQWCNHAFAAMFGYGVDEILGVETSSLYAHHEDFEMVGREGYAALTEGRSYSVEVENLRKDGSTFWCAIVGRAIDPACLEEGSIWSLQDVTERRMTEESLRRSEARLEAAQAQAHIGSWDLDSVTVIGHWSKEMYRIMRRDPESGPPTFAEFLDMVHPDDREGLSGAQAAAIESGEQTFFEHRSNPEHGSVRFLATSIQAVRDAEGGFVRITGTLQDITDRVRAEEAVRETQERLGLALQGADLGTWDWDVQTGAVIFDERWAGMLGYRLDEIEPHFRSWRDRLHPDDAQMAVDVLNDHVQGNIPLFEVEVRLRHRDGSWVWVLSRGKVIARDAGGKALRAVGTHLDITARKQKEEALLSSERKLAEIFRASPAFIVVGTIAEARFLEVNQAFVERLGFSLEETIGHTAFDIGFWPSSEDRERVLREVAKHGEATNVETRMCRKSGEVLDVSVSAAPITVDGEPCLIWVASDITERKRIETAVRESENRFKRLVQNSNDIIAVVNENCVPLAIHGSIKGILGHDAEDLVGRCAFDFIHPGDLESVKRVFAEVVSNPGTTRRLEFQMRHRSGAWVAVESVGTSWLHDPAIRGVVLNVRDVSERKHAEAERARLQEQLQQAMKMEAVGRLAGGIAHDFNNLLTVVSGNVELGRTGLPASDPLRQCFDEIKTAADSGASLTRQLLAFSRRQIIEPKVLSLNELVDNTRKMLVRIIGEDVVLQTGLPTDLGLVKVDPGQFEQVLVNLAVNARDAMPHGGRLTIETLNTELDEGYCEVHTDVQPGRFVMLAVSDTGQGMTEDVKQRLFEPFFTTKPKGRGTGLGLAMIFGAVKQSGGTIEVYSEPGQGTTFKIYLPRIEGQAEKLSKPAGPLDLPRGDETVLLVEDETSVRDLAAKVLKRLGYRVLTAPNGGEAFMLVENYHDRIDLLMTDVVMPGMNGRELANRLRKLHPEMEVLFTSGYTENVIVHHGVVDEDVNFIGKPYSIQGVAQKVRKLLDSRRQGGAPPSAG